MGDDVQPAADSFTITDRHVILDGPQSVQDYADGVALRRLHEALPEGGWCVVHWDRESPAPLIGAYRPAPGADMHRGPVVRFVGRGATVEESADKCREAMR